MLKTIVSRTLYSQLTSIKTDVCLVSASRLSGGKGIDEGRKSVILDIAGYPPGERVKNQIGAREALPKQYGDAPEYTLVVAGGDTDIKPVPTIELEARIRRAHSLIWAGGRRDIPLADCA